MSITIISKCFILTIIGYGECIELIDSTLELIESVRNWNTRRCGYSSDSSVVRIVEKYAKIIGIDLQPPTYANLSIQHVSYGESSITISSCPNLPTYSTNEYFKSSIWLPYLDSVIENLKMLVVKSCLSSMSTIKREYKQVWLKIGYLIQYFLFVKRSDTLYSGQILI